MNAREIEELSRGYFADFDARDVEGVVSRFAEECVATMEPPNNVWRGRNGIRSWLDDVLSTTSATDHVTTRFTVDERQQLGVFEQNVAVAWKDRPDSRLHNVTLIQFDDEGLITNVSFWVGHDTLGVT